MKMLSLLQLVESKYVELWKFYYFYYTWGLYTYFPLIYTCRWTCRLNGGGPHCQGVCSQDFMDTCTLHTGPYEATRRLWKFLRKLLVCKSLSLCYDSDVFEWHNRFLLCRGFKLCDSLLYTHVATCSPKTGVMLWVGLGCGFNGYWPEGSVGWWWLINCRIKNNVPNRSSESYIKSGRLY